MASPISKAESYLKGKMGLSDLCNNKPLSSFLLFLLLKDNSLPSFKTSAFAWTICWAVRRSMAPNGGGGEPDAARSDACLSGASPAEMPTAATLISRGRGKGRAGGEDGRNRPATAH